MLLAGVAGATLLASGSVAVAVYMAINFHHYVVDSMIWKRNSPTLAALERLHPSARPSAAR